jgi:RNA polymerase sigma factor (TIGR02999 family)
MGPAASDITGLLADWSRGDREAFDRLLPLVYSELRRIAHARLRHESPGHLLQTTGLVHEAYLRLVKSPAADWQNRRHFFSVAAKIMRRVLVDDARERSADKRGGDAPRQPFDESTTPAPSRSADLLALDDALTALAAFDSRKERVVELRYFGGLTLEETAAVLQVSSDTVARDWRMARLWLLRELERRGPGAGGS